MPMRTSSGPKPITSTRASPPIFRNLSAWPRCTTRPRSTSSRSSPSRKRASCRCGRASSNASAFPQRRCRRRSAGSAITDTSSCTATAACTSPTRAGGLATTVVRRHRLAERLLVDVIGLEWEKVHREADRWEHAISSDVEEKLVAAARRPGHVPAREPDPRLEAPRERCAHLRARAQRSRTGRRAPRQRTPRDRRRRNRLLAEARMMPGCEATVVENIDGTVTIDTETGQHTLPRASPRTSTSRFPNYSAATSGPLSPVRLRSTDRACGSAPGPTIRLRPPALYRPCDFGRLTGPADLRLGQLFGCDLRPSITRVRLRST